MIFAENIFICIVTPLIVSLLFVQGSARRFVAFFLGGMTICLLSAYISAFFATISGFSANDAALYISPTIEEILCILPILFYMFVFEPKDMDLFFAGIALGVGFATFENCCYILNESAGSITFMMIRGLSTGVMHLVCATIFSFGLILTRRINELNRACIVGALAFSVTFHALYNLLVSEKGAIAAAGYIMPMATVLIIKYLHGKIRPRVSADVIN